MASFTTFGSGNARKVLSLPLYAASAALSVFVPRTKKLWVFGSGTGLGEGALPLFELARERLGESTRLVWLTSTDAELAEATARGFDTLPKKGWRGFWTTSRARVVVLTHGFGDVNRFGTRGAYVVQLWHGLQFKHLHLDSPATYRVSFLPDIAVVRSLIGAAYRRAGRAISLFPVPSKRVAASVASGIGVDPTHIAVIGEPRDDVLTAGTEDERRSHARALLDAAVPDLPSDAAIVLFTPTWRDGAADPTVPTKAEWAAIAAWLEAQDAVLIVRTHPLGRGDYTDGPALSPRVRFMGSDVQHDVNPVLWAVDALVTDYSSIVFDFSLVGRPVVFFTPDLESYSRSRGFYVPFDEFTGGSSVSTWRDTTLRLTQVLAEGEDGDAHKHARHLREQFFEVSDGQATERVFSTIADAIGVSDSTV